MKIAEMMDDPRPIRMVNDDIGGQNIFAVGSHGVTAIVCYGEPGNGAMVPWLAIYKGEQITARMGVRSELTIHYAEAE